MASDPEDLYRKKKRKENGAQMNRCPANIRGMKKKQGNSQQRPSSSPKPRTHYLTIKISQTKAYTGVQSTIPTAYASHPPLCECRKAQIVEPHQLINTYYLFTPPPNSST